MKGGRAECRIGLPVEAVIAIPCKTNARRPSVMIEKFAILSGKVESEFLDLNHTNNLLNLEHDGLGLNHHRALSLCFPA
jgi:hypothetical protein